MHIYAFGSVCRGEVSRTSDVDLLAIVDGHDARFDPSVYSIYSYQRIRDLWQMGNPFAWHLSLESRILFTTDSHDFLKSLGSPEPYKDCRRDCINFHDLYCEAHASANGLGRSRVFDLGTMFLGIRNFATCFSLRMSERPIFSRDSALRLGHHSLKIGPEPYGVLERARILATRGYGEPLSIDEILLAVGCGVEVKRWMSALLEQVESHV